MRTRKLMAGEAQLASGPDRQNRRTKPDMRSEAMCGLVAALLGGIAGWTAVFAGLGGWGLLIGFPAIAIVLLALANDPKVQHSLSAMAAFSFAFVLLSWPVLWLLVGLIWYAITGQSFGE